MAKRFIDLYNDAQQKKQAGTQKASLPAAPAQKKPQTVQKASLSQLSMPGSIGQAYRDELPALEMPRLKAARTAAPQIKKSYAPRADGLPNIRALGAGDYTGSAKLMGKAAQTVKAGVLGAASGIAEIAGQATPTTGDQHLGQFSGLGDLGRAVRESRETGADIGKSIQRMEQERSARRKESQRKTYDAATTLSEKSAALQEKAKQGAGKVGGFLVDLGVTGTQVAGDTLANALLPGSGMAMMAARVYGQSAGDARREGKTEGQQVAAGLKSAAIEVLTEKLFGGLAKAYGAGTADEVVEKIAEKLTRSEAGKRAATWLINSGGEGVEEVLSDILNPLADRALGLDTGKGNIFTAGDAAQMGYDFLLGTAMGALGGAGQLRGTKNAPAARDGQTVRKVKMPELVDANGRTSEQIRVKDAKSTVRLNNENGLDAYTPQERINLSSGAKNKIVSTYQEALTFVKSALANGKNIDRAYMGIVPNIVAGKILAETGVDVSGYGVMMNGDDVRHILKGHGNSGAEAARGQVAVTEGAVARIPQVIAHPDNVYLSADADGKGRRAIVFEKRIGDTYVTIQGVANGKKLLQTDTLYIRKRRTRKPQNTMPDTTESAVPVTNVQNELPQSSSFTDTTIPPMAEGVNTQGMQQGAEYAPAEKGYVPQFVYQGDQIVLDSSGVTARDAMTWQDVYDYESRNDAPAAVETETVSEADRAEVEEYLNALAQDENVFTVDPYTVSDAVYDAQLRRLERQEPPRLRTWEEVTQADLDDLARLYADQADRIGTREDEIKAKTDGAISTASIPQKQSARQGAKEAWDYFYRRMVDAGHSVTRFAEAVNDPYLYQFFNQARASSSAGVNMITDAQTDVTGRRIGDSLNSVFAPIRSKGDEYYRAFQTYMFDLHNIDRMSLSKGKAEKVLEAQAALHHFDMNNPDLRTETAAQLHRLTEDVDEDVASRAREKEHLIRALDQAEAIKDKPVFDYSVTAEDSRARAEELLRQHPEFAEYRENVRKYIDNMMQYRVDSGLMTQEDADFLKKFYPNYVPTMRVMDTGGAGRGRDLNAVRIGKTVGRAEGGTERLLPLHEALGKQTMKVVREGSKNRFAERLLRDYIRTGDREKVNRYVKEAGKKEFEFDPAALDDASMERPTKEKIVTAYMDGDLWEMTVDDTLFDAIKTLSPDAKESNRLTKTVRAANNLFKSLVTGYNPTFLARNVIRDLQTAGLNTRDAKAFARNYPRALSEIRNNGKYWQMYKALGGVYSSVFDYATGTVKEPKGKLGKVTALIETLNMAAEQAPRLAEFIGVMDKAEAARSRGEPVSELAAAADALYAAADITVNFGRAGSLGKVLNANYVPFLNPGVQGLDKLVRRVTETKGGKEWAKLVGRIAALGIAPSVLNALLYHDDEEWDELRDSDKDTNYLFKLGNGYWLKIPKGRELSIFGIAADRIGDAVKGEDVDILSTLNTIGNQVAPANPLKNNIASALIDSQLLNSDSPGRTWYGGDIESQRLRSYAPGERYDSSTDVFSKAVGGALGISPKKLNYVLDQYSGVVGDFLLPLLTPQAERDPFSKAFTVDAKSSNRVSGDFYDEANELKYAKNDGDAASGVVSRWWSKQQSACSDVYKKIREVEASPELSNSEKRRQTRELKAIVTGIQRNALNVESTYRRAVEKNLAAGEDEDTAYRSANRECFGAEYALQTYSKDVYERAKDARRNGVSYDDFYGYYFGTKDIKATETTSAITQKFQYLLSSGMDTAAQAELYFADMASDKTLLTQAQLETDNGISAEQYYTYKAASSGMTKKAEKLLAIDSLDLTAEQKDALYYSEGWAESKLYEAPWRSGGYVGVTMPVLGSRGNTDVQMPVLKEWTGGDLSMPVLKERTVQTIRMPVLG